MPSWTETEYVKRAADIAQQSVVSKKTLNDVCEKFAQDNALNPEEIRTVVRLANVAMFQAQFKAKDAAGAPDRHVEFEVGDPETVIQRLHTAAAVPQESANVMNDKLAGEVPDMMAATRRGFEYETVTEKIAQDLEVKPGRTDMVILTMRKLAEEYDTRRLSAGFRWEEKMAAVYDQLKKAPGYAPAFVEFEKDAYAELGESAAPELESLRKDLRIQAPVISADERAKLAEHRMTEDSAQVDLIKAAVEARVDYTACEEAVAWVKKNMPTLED